jgi:hypothetical protein
LQAIENPKATYKVNVTSLRKRMSYGALMDATQFNPPSGEIREVKNSRAGMPQKSKSGSLAIPPLSRGRLQRAIRFDGKKHASGQHASFLLVSGRRLAC